MKKGVAVVVSRFMSKTAFDFFGLKPCYNLNLPDLEQRYLVAQATIHPDRFVNRSDFEKKLAVTQAADINQAYLKLKCPIKRAAELLTAKQIPLPGKDGQTVNDPALLAEMMDWQEQILEVDSPEGYTEIIQSLRHRRQKIQQHFDQSEDTDLPRLYVELSYLLKLEDELKSKGS
jgi:molecular chaperone HscB